jgi:phenylalanine ammonia-lyase
MKRYSALVTADGSTRSDSYTRGERNVSGFREATWNRAVRVIGNGLDFTDLVRVARASTPVLLGEDVRLRAELEDCRSLKERLIAEGHPIYGVTTGFGDSANRQVGGAKAKDLQKNLVRMMGCGTGAFAPEDEARATVLIRANCLARGHSAVRPLVIERLLDLLNTQITPAIRERGSVGASGDLVPLSYVAAALQGMRQVFYRGELRQTAEVFEETAVEPIELESKEALALLNGTAYMAAIASLAAYDAASVAMTADVCTALTVEVIGGLPGSFAPFVHDVAKPHPGQVRTAANVRALLAGSQLVQTEPVPGGGDHGAGGMRVLSRHVQDRYSIRCAPHFIGGLWDTLEWVTAWLEREINSSTDNPLFDVGSGQVHNGGNFAGSHVGLASDALRTAVASIADLCDRQFALIVDEKFSQGLPPNLVFPLPVEHPEAGVRHGFKGLQIACSSLVAEALHLCAPVTTHSRSTECHNQDKVSMATIAARRTRDVVRLTEEVLACHLLALCQAADVRGSARLGRTRMVYDRVRAVSPAVSCDRELEQDVSAVVQLIRSRELFRGLPLSDQDRKAEAAE